MADEIVDGKFEGNPVAARFTPDTSFKADAVVDVADEYIIVRSEEAACGVIVYGLYHGGWVPNPFSTRPVIRWLLDRYDRVIEECGEINAILDGWGVTGDTLLSRITRLTEHILLIDWDSLSEEQLQRIIAGENPLYVLNPISDSYACYRCGRRDGLDAVVPADIWIQISPTGDEGGLLCLWCIDQLCAEKGIKCSASLHFAGCAITGTSQSDADRDHIRRVCAQSDALEKLLAAYRAKRVVDGGGALEKDDGSKTPSRHYEADVRIEELEARFGLRLPPDKPSIDDCLYHRCYEHRAVRQFNANDGNGGECGACIALQPISMILHCPSCGLQHIDAPEPETGWTNPPHKSHKCRPQDGGCGAVWRPADVPTYGVAAIATRGDADTWPLRGEE